MELGTFTARLKFPKIFFADYIFLKKKWKIIRVFSVARPCGFISMSLEFRKSRIFHSTAQMSTSPEIFHINIYIFYIAPLLICNGGFLVLDRNWYTVSFPECIYLVNLWCQNGLKWNRSWPALVRQERRSEQVYINHNILKWCSSLFVHRLMYFFDVSKEFAASVFRVTEMYWGECISVLQHSVRNQKTIVCMVHVAKTEKFCSVCVCLIYKNNLSGILTFGNL